jgi:hypothetical protein
MNDVVMMGRQQVEESLLKYKAQQNIHTTRDDAMMPIRSGLRPNPQFNYRRRTDDVER